MNQINQRLSFSSLYIPHMVVYSLKPIFDIPLHIPTQTIVTTGGNTHILSPLRDGSLAVIGVQQPIANKKHTIVSI
jgi:neurobeachin-like protein 1/2